MYCIDTLVKKWNERGTFQFKKLGAVQDEAAALLPCFCGTGEWPLTDKANVSSGLIAAVLKIASRLARLQQSLVVR
jgi:hypothetical protein